MKKMIVALFVVSSVIAGSLYALEVKVSDFKEGAPAVQDEKVAGEKTDEAKPADVKDAHGEMMPADSEMSK